MKYINFALPVNKSIELTTGWKCKRIISVSVMPPHKHYAGKVSISYEE